VNEVEPSRVATVRLTDEFGPRPLYLVTYTEDGRPAGRSLAGEENIEQWRDHLREGGWIVEDADEDTVPG